MNLRGLCTANEMKIFVTNDDGIDAEGLHACVRALEGNDVFVVAPDCQRSAASGSLTLNRPVSFFEVDFPGTVGAYACNGTPVDCAKLGLGKLLPWPADVLISGLNEGLNVGQDVLYSGTVAAAMEAVSVSAPAVACSLQRPIEKSIENAVALLPKLARIAAKWIGSGRYILNVNIPATPDPEIVIARHGSAAYRYWYENEIGGDLGFCWLKGVPERDSSRFDTDDNVVFSGCVAVSPLRASFCAFPYDSRGDIAHLAELIMSENERLK